MSTFVTRKVAELNKPIANKHTPSDMITDDRWQMTDHVISTSAHQHISTLKNLASVPQWLALYTKSRQEKVVMQRLMEDGIEAYVPLQKVIRQWSDRKKLVEEPLIRSYCFVNVAPAQQHQVLSTPGAVRYVWFSGKPAAIPARQIDLLKIITGYNIPVECVPGNIKPGTKVKITAGPMAGYEGEIISSSGKSRVIIRIEQLETAISLSISPALLERMKNEK